MIRVSFDEMEKVIVSGVEQVGDDRHVIATVIAKFHYTDPTGPGSPTKSTHVVGYSDEGGVYHASAALASHTADWCRTTGE